MKKRNFWVLILLVLASSCNQGNPEKDGQVHNDFANKEYVDSLIADVKIEMRAVVDSAKRYMAQATVDVASINPDEVKNPNLVRNHEFGSFFVMDNKRDIFVSSIDSFKYEVVNVVSTDKFSDYDGKSMYRDAETRLSLNVDGFERVVVLRHVFDTPYKTYVNGQVFPELYIRFIKSIKYASNGQRHVYFVIEISNKDEGQTAYTSFRIKEKPVVD